MAEYGNYKKEIKTLGDLRGFVNETLKDIEDDYTFDIDDDFTGVDITLCANCDVSYSEKSFYWSTNSHWYSDLTTTIERKSELEEKAKAFDIIDKKNVEMYWLKHSKTVEEYNKHIKNLRDTFKLTQEEFDLIKKITSRTLN